jgi:hypothetical protein
VPLDGATKSALLARLEGQTDKTETCWLWRGYIKNAYGHGAISVHNRPVFVHQLAYAIFHGPIPPGRVVRHRCDVPPCWRPEHLTGGMQLDSVGDMQRRGRAVAPPRIVREPHHNVTLTDVQVVAIRAAWAARPGIQRALGPRTGVSQSTIWRLVRAWSTDHAHWGFRMSLKLALDLVLPAEAATQTFLVVGKRGSGKSNTAVRFAGQLTHAGVPWVAIDPVDNWHGVKSSRDGKSPGLSVYVFGGPHGDLPLEATAGALIADTIVDHRITAVLSVKHFSGRERGRFVGDFAQRLFQRNKEPLHVFLEEAHEVAPQHDEDLGLRRDVLRERRRPLVMAEPPSPDERPSFQIRATWPSISSSPLNGRALRELDHHTALHRTRGGPAADCPRDDRRDDGV